MRKLRGFYSVEETKKILNDVGVELRVDLPENSIVSDEVIDELYEGTSVFNKVVVVISDLPPERKCVWLRPLTLRTFTGSAEVERLYFNWNPFLESNS